MEIAENLVIVSNGKAVQLSSNYIPEDELDPFPEDNNLSKSGVEKLLKALKFNPILEISDSLNKLSFGDDCYMSKKECKTAIQILKMCKGKEFNFVSYNENMGNVTKFKSLSGNYCKHLRCFDNFKFYVDDVTIKEGYFDVYFVNDFDCGIGTFASLDNEIKVTLDGDETYSCYIPSFTDKNNSMHRSGTLFLNEEMTCGINVHRFRVLVCD